MSPDRDQDRMLRCIPSVGRLADDEVHVVSVRVDSATEADTAVLNADERTRASRFVFTRDRDRFVAAHACLRRVLARCLGCAPHDLIFGSTTNGKPYLIGSATELHFNLSHSAERAVIALARGREVGVDIEQARPIEVLALATRFFAAGELAALRGRPAAEQPPAFFRCWTRKEAFIKALGEGLLHPLDSFEVDVDGEGTAPLLLRTQAERALPARWQVRSLRVERGYAAAVAAAGSEWRTIQHDLSLDGEQVPASSES